MEEEIRVRIAPSPTGKLHFGTARTALFNYIFAKKLSGKFILRIEDTDKKRSKQEFQKDIEESLKWLGLRWDEGPGTDGPYKPYLQSERGEIYKTYIEKLLTEKKAYYCFCTEDELRIEREKQVSNKEAPQYSGKCSNLTEEEQKKLWDEGRKPCLRFISGEDTVEFEDLIRGKMKFNMKEFDDFAIVASDGQPLFLLTNAIDDSLMKISHVLRGEDHLANTPKQIKLMEAMDFLPPEYGHLPLILNADKSKLSKRTNPTSISEDFRAKGYLPEALINFMVLMGWAPGDNNEIFSLEQLETSFSLERVGKSPAIFDANKLDYLNGYYIRQMKLGDLAELCLDQLNISDSEIAKSAKAEMQYYLKTIALVQERLKRLDEVGGLIKFFFVEHLDYGKDLLLPKDMQEEQLKDILNHVSVALQKTEPFDRDTIERDLRAVISELGVGNGDVLWPVRVAITGEKASPGVFEVLEVLGKERALERLQDAIVRLKR